MPKLLPLIAATLLGLAGAAQAETVSYTDLLAFDYTDWDSTQAGSESRQLQVNRFDPALGTLTGVTLSYGGALQTLFSGTNSERRAVNLIGTLSGELSFLLPGGETFSLNLQGEAGSVVDSRQAYSFEGLALGAGVAQSLDLALFTGSGMLLVDTVANGSGQITSGGNGSGMVLTQANAGLTVTYEYTLRQPQRNEVPEPGALALLGLALAAAATAQRRRQA